MNIREVLRQLNVPFKEHGEHGHCTQGYVNVDCSSCSPRSGHYRLGINIAYGNCNCWACGPKRLFQVLLDITGASTKEIGGLVSGLERVSERKEWQHKGTLKLPRGVGELLPAHLKYLRRRYFSPDELSSLWGIKGIGKDGGRPWRIFIPIVFRGETVSWTTRSISDQHEGRYWSASPGEEAIPHKRVLFGWDYVRHTAIVCEGPFDAMRIGPGAVCTFGTSFTPSQMLLLSSLPRVVVCYDPEPHAQRQAQRICNTLAATSVSEVYNVVLDDADPGEATAEAVAALRRRFLDD